MSLRKQSGTFASVRVVPSPTTRRTSGYETTRTKHCALISMSVVDGRLTQLPPRSGDSTYLLHGSEHSAAYATFGALTRLKNCSSAPALPCRSPSSLYASVRALPQYFRYRIASHLARGPWIWNLTKYAPSRVSTVRRCSESRVTLIFNLQVDLDPVNLLATLLGSQLI